MLSAWLAMWYSLDRWENFTLRYTLMASSKARASRIILSQKTAVLLLVFVERPKRIAGALRVFLSVPSAETRQKAQYGPDRVW